MRANETELRAKAAEVCADLAAEFLAKLRVVAANDQPEIFEVASGEAGTFGATNCDEEFIDGAIGDSTGDVERFVAPVGNANVFEAEALGTGASVMAADEVASFEMEADGDAAALAAAASETAGAAATSEAEMDD